MGNFKEDIARTEAFIFDVDGVMTDGGIIPTLDGDFIRRYNAKDGYALGYAVKMGYKVCIITGGRGKTLENRLRMLGINRYYTDCMDKITAMREYFADEGIDPAHAIYMGDDIPDLECMREVGIPVCPADAAAEVIEASRYVSKGPCATLSSRCSAPAATGRKTPRASPRRRWRRRGKPATKRPRKSRASCEARLFHILPKGTYCIHSTSVASRNRMLSGRAMLSAFAAKMNRTLSRGTVRNTVEG